jgi:tRNA (Thr-GGU) A37 N-methylase
MGDLESNLLQRIGTVRSPLKDRKEAPNQGSEGAPDVWIELTPSVAEGVEGIAPATSSSSLLGYMRLGATSRQRVRRPGSVL